MQQVAGALIAPVAPARPLAFNDLAAQRARIGDRIDKAIARVVAHGQFIMGPEILEFEERLADFCSVEHVISCASGTDALALVLMAIGIKPGDAVFVPAFTFVATAEVVVLLGAAPVFVDVDPRTFNMDVEGLENAVHHAASLGLRPRAVIPVDLFGLPADYQAIKALAARHGMFVLADAAQSCGASSFGRRVGGLAVATATSFFPAKPLGCYGDGGAVMTDDGELAAVIRSLRVHGQGRHKYDNVRVGINGRLDTIQAAILIEKLAILDDEIAARGRIAERYAQGLGESVTTPILTPGAVSAWAQYTIRMPGGRRDELTSFLGKRGIPTAVYYPIPLPRQTAYADYPSAPGGAPESDRLASEVLSLPMHPYLSPAEQDRVIAAVRDGFSQSGSS